MVHAEYPADRMRDDQPHKPDHARHVHDKSHHQRSDDQIYPPVRLQVRPQRDRRVIPHEHQVQYPRLGNKEKRAGQHDAQNTKITAPLCAGQASHQPELHRHKPARVIRDVHDQVRKAEQSELSATPAKISFTEVMRPPMPAMAITENAAASAPMNAPSPTPAAPKSPAPSRSVSVAPSDAPEEIPSTYGSASGF